MAICEICKKNYVGWTTFPIYWKKLPENLQNKELCKKCFKKYSGVRRPKYLTQEEVQDSKFSRRYYN